MEKLDKFKSYAEAGQLAQLTHNKDTITRSGMLQKLHLERAEKLGNKAIIACSMGNVYKNLFIKLCFVFIQLRYLPMKDYFIYFR